MLAHDGVSGDLHPPQTKMQRRTPLERQRCRVKRPARKSADHCPRRRAGQSDTG